MHVSMYIKELKTEELLNMTQINPELPCHPQIFLPHIRLWDLFRELKLNKSWTVSHNNSFYDYGFIDYVKYSLRM